MKKITLLFLVLGTLAYSQTEEETLVWLREYAMELSQVSFYTIVNEYYRPKSSYVFYDGEYIGYSVNEYKTTYNTLNDDINSKYLIKYTDFKHLYILPVENSIHLNENGYIYDQSREGNDKFTGIKTSYYTLILAFREPVIKAEGAYGGFYSDNLVLYFPSLENAQSVIKAINHLAKLQGAKPKPQVKKNMF